MTQLHSTTRLLPRIRIAVRIDDMAAMLSVSVSTVRTWSKREVDPLPFLMAGTEKRFPVREVLKWVARQTEAK